jgi:RNA polymerase sigma factor (sigma-70 family)
VVRHQRRKQRLWRWLRGSAEDIAGGLASSEPTPLEDAERRSAREQVYRILDGMNERYRTALILSELEGLDAAEIAERLGMSRENFWVLLHRARTDFVRRQAKAQAGETEEHHG